MPRAGFISTNVKQLLYYHLNIRKKNSLEQSPQGHGRVLITEGFQDATGQGTVKPHWDSFSQASLDQMIFWDSFYWGLFYDSVIHNNTLASNPDSFMVKSNRSKFIRPLFKSVHEKETNHALGDFSGFVSLTATGNLGQLIPTYAAVPHQGESPLTCPHFSQTTFQLW